MFQGFVERAGIAEGVGEIETESMSLRRESERFLESANGLVILVEEKVALANELKECRVVLCFHLLQM